MFLLLLIAPTALHAAKCDISGQWVRREGTPSRTQTYAAQDLTDVPGVNFNVNYNIRHGPEGGNGTYVGDYGLRMQVITWNGQTHVSYYQTGQFTPNCTAIVWDDKPVPPNTRSSTDGHWCKAWTVGCESPPPPYGLTMSFYQTFGDNMVLQRAPAQAAVYGIYGPAATAPKNAQITVTVSGGGKTYNVKAEINTVHQTTGPEWASCAIGPGSCNPPYGTWKALLPPTQAGGSYTIYANCTGCGGDPQYWNANPITNVTFGDVWHCSGQSNMWLPLGNSFHRNDTLKSIRSGTKYTNMRGMIGNSGNGNNVLSNPWMTAAMAAVKPDRGDPPLMAFGAACWYFGQRVVDLSTAAGDLTAEGEPVPIGLINTAIGGQRIEEYMVNDTTIYKCSDRIGTPEWNGMLFAKMIMPFVDMTTKGFLWYQGENNMGGTKGNSAANVGYGCEQQKLVEGWRKIFSETPGTTDPLAPFGIVTLASSGSEGGPNMGAMRQAQTANYGILPNPALPNTFVAQAYDLDDEWGPAAGPCVGSEWACCPFQCQGCAPFNKTSCNAGTNGHPEKCLPACNAALDTPYRMGGIHPRSKKQVGDRLGTAYFNTLAGGNEAFTGPTLSGCSVNDNKLSIHFNTSLLMGDTLKINKWGEPWTAPVRHASPTGGSQLFVQTNASLFCMEVTGVRNTTSGGNIPGLEQCPKWSGGDGKSRDSAFGLDSGWIRLNFTLDSAGTGVDVDLTPLNGSTPTAVKYAWGIVQCCDHYDPTLYVSHGCVANCPIYSNKAGLPANPFKARIVNGACECVAPQVCS